MMNYSLGGPKGPGKKKKVKGKPTTAEEAGKESKKKRMAQFDNAKDKKDVAKTMSVNTNMKEEIDKGLEQNEYGAPKGTQKKRKYGSLIKNTAKSKF